MHGKLGLPPHPYRIEVDIPRYLLKVGISIDDKGFISTLVEMTCFPMGAVIIRGVRDIKVAHKFLKVS